MSLQKINVVKFPVLPRLGGEVFLLEKRTAVVKSHHNYKYSQFT